MRPDLDTSKLALVYPRQSSGLQVKENIYSLENQMKLVDQAKADGFPGDRVLVIDEDLGKSARTIENRVGMVKALNLVDQGLVGAMYAEDQTRLSRDRDTVDHMIIAKRCRKAGVPLFYGGSWRNLSDWGTRVAYKVEAVIGSEMWGQHQDKMYRAMRAKAAKGQAVTRPPLYGYRLRKDLPRKDPKRDTLVVHEEEAAIIRTLANRLEEVGSLRQLYRSLNGACWPDGRPITLGHLQKVLKKPTFRGHYVWGDVIVEDAHEAIIPPEQGARIDALLARNKSTLRRPASRGPQLLGLVYCSTCPKRLTVYGSGVERRQIYICKANSTPGPTVRHFEMSAAILDSLVLKHFWRRLEDDLIESTIAHLKSQERDRLKVVDLREGTVRGLQRRVDGLTVSLSDPDIPDAARRVLILQLDQAARELEAAMAPPEPKGKVQESISFYEGLRGQKDWLAILKGTWEDEPLAWRRGWLWQFIDRVAITCPRTGELAVAIHFRDGKTTIEKVQTRIPVTEEELALALRLWNDPERPPDTWAAWIQERLVAAGYPRSKDSARRIVKIARQQDAAQ